MYSKTTIVLTKKGNISIFEACLMYTKLVFVGVFIVEVSIRRGNGPEWFEKTFTVDYSDMVSDISIEDLKEWAKEEVRNQLKSHTDDVDGENWIIQDVVLKSM